jgi:hypothetical protein
MICAIFYSSLFLVVLVFAWRRVPLVSAYGMFLAFQGLYNLVPWYTNSLFPGLFPLDPDVISTQLVLASTANLAFAVAVALFYRQVELRAREIPAPVIGRRYLLWSMPLFLITAVLCHYYGWHTFAAIGSADETTAATSLTAYAKHACIATYLYAIYRFEIGRTTWFLFFAIIVIMSIDGGRTGFFPIIVVTLMMWQAKSHVSIVKIALVFLVAVALLQVIRGILLGNTGIDLVAGPFFTEGYMGSFSSRQSITAIQNMSEPPYQFGIGSIENWSKDIYPRIPGEFAPLGGHYFVAEAVAHFGYFGPALFAFVFGCVLSYSEQWKRTHALVYLAFTATIGILFVKTPLLVESKLFLAQLLFLLLLEAMHRYRKVVEWSAARILAHPPV